ncbi:MAG: phage-shock protein [Actinobacteria bacterium]|nr:phage-shock protein [Actinomycetota bacterium]
MGGKLHSLTDVLKKTLFFFEELSVAEVVPHVHRRMLRDYSQDQVEEKVLLCLRQNHCFDYNEKGLWSLNLEGGRDNDQFYSLLLRKQQPVSVKEVLKTGLGPKNKKKTKPLVSGEASLISDGRFIQLENGLWGLTEWEVEAGQYSLKQLVIKAHKKHPGGLSAQQIFEIVNSWRETGIKAVEGVLTKFPYFEEIGDGIWAYSSSIQVAYEGMMKRFLSSVNRQREKWQRDRLRWKKKTESIERQVYEVSCAHREVAAALAARLEEAGQHDYLVTQMAEKDLLLSLRKKEIYRYREHVARLESKASSILHQCRLWVRRAREAEGERERYREVLNKNQASLEALFTKLQQYKEKDRENKVRLAELKDRSAEKTAGLQSEIVDLRQKLEKSVESHALENKRHMEEISILSNDLKTSLENSEEAKRSLRFLQQELAQSRSRLSSVEESIKSPLVRGLIKILSFFPSSKKGEAS